VLPAIRNHVNFDLRRRGLPREKVLAVIVRLLDMTMIRIGNADYEKQNGSYGLTTLLSRHLLIQGNELRFRFRGKAAKRWNLTLRDQRMARVLEAIRQLPGRRLFQYAATDGRSCALTSTAVNAYLRDISGADVTAKDFRTWHGTVLAAVKLAALGHRDHETAAKRSIGDVIGQVAARLGNTPAVCRRCYVHPQVIASYLAGRLNLDAPQENTKSEGGLGPDEARVLAFLQDHTNDRREA
jgi:DNA topoisomerase-1